MTDKNGNSNCLEGMECPKCKQHETFHISTEVWVEVQDTGTEDLQQDYEWDKKNPCKCPECNFEGTIKTFTIKGKSKS